MKVVVLFVALSACQQSTEAFFFGRIFEQIFGGRRPHQQQQPQIQYVYRDKPCPPPALHNMNTMTSTSRPKGANSNRKNLLEVAQEAGYFKSLLNIVSKGGLTNTLKDQSCKTILAPPDDIVKKLPQGALENLIKSGKVAQVLSRHVIAQCLQSKDIKSGPIATAGGEMIKFIQMPGGKIQIEANKKIYNVTNADILANNGVIHVVDGIFL